ncbi:flagellar filament capping protein FliD [Rugamonas sp. DEMB1]|uniref:flagellar filament capping protein FliD n=1 Tax=Rugamonas sp. DEMB1 TaxID=3039386 RepID=UPI00244D2404|nr:flagellar filament capping protein FliD [Rugamonas sp. DEMB1]WGG48363.1 flagellar filament capping protein FliD [Rugamonas sp. DEMB1]
MALNNINYDPKTTATNLANAYVAGSQSMIDSRSKVATATKTALTTLSSAMGAFQSALSSLSLGSKTMSANAATFSSAVGTATATSAAIAGTYSFYVERLATAGQVSYGGLSDTTAAGSGNLSVMLADGSNFQVSLNTADSNMDGNLSPKEIAAAINIAAGNSSRVTASTMSLNGATTLVLTSNLTGAANAASLDTSGVTNAALKAALDAPANQNQVVAAQDALVWVGAKTTGTQIVQASNVFSVVDGVTMTFTKAQAATETAPVTLTVAADTAATSANVQAFVDAYNKVITTLDGLTDVGDPSKGVGAAVFASDSGLAALRNRMLGTLRTAVGGQTLVNYGISAKRDGTLGLDTARLGKAVLANPGGLDGLFGKASLSSSSGVLGALDKLMAQWTSSANGQLASRKVSVDKEQISLTDRQAKVQTQFQNAYNRYLVQFTNLQTLQSKMNNTSSLFTALFSSSNSSS